MVRGEGQMRVRECEYRSYIRATQFEGEAVLEDLRGVYLYVLPLVLLAALTEAVVLTLRKRLLAV